MLSLHIRKLWILSNWKRSTTPESSTSLDIRSNGHQIIELRIITLENIIDDLQKKIRKLEDRIERISALITIAE